MLPIVFLFYYFTNSGFVPIPCQLHPFMITGSRVHGVTQTVMTLENCHSIEYANKTTKISSAQILRTADLDRVVLGYTVDIYFLIEKEESNSCSQTKGSFAGGPCGYSHDAR